MATCLPSLVFFRIWKKKTATTTDVASAVRKLSGSITPLALEELDIPPKAKEYVICLKLQGCIKGVVSNIADNDFIVRDQWRRDLNHLLGRKLFPSLFQSL